MDPSEPGRKSRYEPERGPRSREVDALRGLGCAAVFAGLSLAAVAARAPSPAQHTVAASAASVLLLGGPLFAFLSGMLCVRRFGTGAQGRQFLQRRLVGLGVPYLLWSAIWLVVWYLLPHPPAEATGNPAWLLLLGVGPYRFLHALFQFYLLFPLFRFLWEVSSRRLLIASCMVAGVAWLEGGGRILPALLPGDTLGLWPPVLGCVLAWLPALALGMWVGDTWQELPAWIEDRRWMWTAFALVVTAGACAYPLVLPQVGPVAGEGLSRLAPLFAHGAFLIWLPVLLGWAVESRSAGASLARELGMISPAVYLATPPVLLGVSAALPASLPWWLAFAAIPLLTLLAVGLIVGLLRRHPAGAWALGLWGRGRPAHPARAVPERLAMPERHGFRASG